MRLFLSFLLSIASTVLFAQVDKSNHALLWEITGNGLEKPSYLFGTMHVQDERAHEFTDSTLLCLDATDAFAMEINFDSLIYDMIEIFTEGDTTNVLKGMLSPEAYHRLNEKMVKETGKSIEEMDNKDPQYLQDLLMDWDEPDYTVKKNQMVDLYLMKRATEQGHRTYGLERMEDYLGVTQSYFKLFENEDIEREPTDEENNAYYEQLIDIYQRGDLSQVESTFVNKEKQTEFDVEMLDKRNKKMVVELIKLMKNQTIFCAVGTAHLPGKEGMLAELKRKGFKVRKVKADFKGYANSYEKTANKSWEEFESKTHLYKLKGPGMAISLKDQVKEFGVGSSAHMNMDILDQDIYIHMVMNFSSMNVEIPEDNVEEAFVKNWIDGKGGEVQKSSDVNRSEIKGKRFYTINDEGSKTVWEIFVKNKMIYVFSAVKEKGAVSEDNYEAYFESIEFTKAEWKKYESEQGAFSLELPQPPTKKRVLVNREYETRENGQMIFKSIIAKDPLTSVSYLVRYSNIDEGTTITDFKVSSMTTIKGMAERFKNPDVVIDSLNFKGCFTYKANFELTKSFFEVYHFYRGNRGMLVGVEYPKIGDYSKEKTRFLESIKLLPFQKTSFHPVSFQEGAYSIGSPGKIVETYTEKTTYPYHGEYGYSAIDTMHSGNFELTVHQINPFYMPTSGDSSVVNFSKETFSFNANKIVKDTVFQGRKAVYVRAKKENADTRIYELIFYEDHYLFDLTVYLSKDLNEEIAWEYFNTFKTKNHSGRKYLLKDKKYLLFKGLTGKDTTALTHAIKAMDYIEFSPNNLPKIYKVLEGKLPENSENRSMVKSILVRELQYTNDQSTIPFMEKIFYENKNNRALQIDILNALADLKSKPSFDLFFKLAKGMTKDKEVELIHSGMFNDLLDTMSLSSQYIEPMFSLTDDPSFSYFVYDFYLKLCAKDATNIEKIKPLIPQLLGQANQIVKAYGLEQAKDSIDSFDFYAHFNRVNSLFGYFKDAKEVGAYYQKIKNIPDANLLINIIDAMLMRNDEVAPAAFEKVATDSYSWKLLLNAIAYENNIDKIPANLFTPERTVKAIAAKTIEDDNNKMTNFNIIDTRIHTLDGEKLNIYTFTFGVDGYEGTYVGICSQPIDKAQVNQNYFDYNSDPYEPENKESIITEFLAAWEE